MEISCSAHSKIISTDFSEQDAKSKEILEKLDNLGERMDNFGKRMDNFGERMDKMER